MSGLARVRGCGLAHARGGLTGRVQVQPRVLLEPRWLKSSIGDLLLSKLTFGELEVGRLVGYFTNRRKLAFDARSQQSRQRHDTSMSSEHAQCAVTEIGKYSPGNEREVVGDFKTVTKLVEPQSGR